MSNKEEEQFKDEVEQLKLQLTKANGNLDRLRSHLLQKEKDSGEMLEELKQQLEDYKARETHISQMEQENLKLKLESQEKEKEYQRILLELNNLQSVMEQFQEAQHNEISLRTLHLTNQVKALQQELARKSEDLNRVIKEKEEYATYKQQCLELKEKLNIVTQENANYKADVAPLQNIIKSLQDTIARLSDNKNKEEVIDKRIIAKMFVSYLQKGPKQMEVLELISRVLHFTDEEKKIVGLIPSKAGWYNPLKSLFGTNNAGNSQLPDQSQASLSQLWVEFLLREAANDSISSEAKQSTLSRNESQNDSQNNK
eukprot:TRINITY_DN6223_c0_g1_i3.p1 TRINITY_DN6223_c0_g1~~TRINITY_DN6223_c0_g1_i3.p1  ORF type:complete len:313 (-),score=68.43 TRINITY_DN6223_c0_g1_i3:34-972(-)